MDESRKVMVMVVCRRKGRELHISPSPPRGENLLIKRKKKKKQESRKTRKKILSNRERVENNKDWLIVMGRKGNGGRINRPFSPPTETKVFSLLFWSLMKTSRSGEELNIVFMHSFVDTFSFLTIKNRMYRHNSMVSGERGRRGWHARRTTRLPPPSPAPSHSLLSIVLIDLRGIGGSQRLPPWFSVLWCRPRNSSNYFII